jgi:hypothetical protein
VITIVASFEQLEGEANALNRQQVAEEWKLLLHQDTGVSPSIVSVTWLPASKGGDAEISLFFTTGESGIQGNPDDLSQLLEKNLLAWYASSTIFSDNVPLRVESWPNQANPPGVRILAD